MVWYAHSGNALGEWHRLADHLASVSKHARKFLAGHPAADEAALAGMLHDLGKYGDRFQARLQGKDSGLDHWSQGASLALTEFHAVAAALAIEGHHIGLQRGSTDSLRRLIGENLPYSVVPGLALSDPDLSRLQSRAAADGLTFEKPASTAITSWKQPVAAMLDVRMLFSCLVDADFLDTEAHFNGGSHGKDQRQPGPQLDAAVALAALDAHVAGLSTTTEAQVNVRDARKTLWACVIRAGQSSRGLFTLTAPTGSGKTLAMLRFALEHAARHGMKRIVLAVPFLTVIEQTARVYGQVFADFPGNFVLEHHSLAGLGVEAQRQDAEGAGERQRRLLAENWDAPIVLTSNVQLLESLFSNRPSSCRKLHNLMDAVILFDEAQSLPQHLAVPTLAALSHLAEAYGSTVVFATATQPAFDSLDTAVKKHAADGWQPREAVPENPALFAALERVTVRWPERGKKRNWAELADDVRRASQVLVVVNLKRHALALLDALTGTDGLFHLSTNLCAEHRRVVMDGVRARLAAGQPCRLISTQCVEAGVDVDFPVVFRAMAPLESIAQAAGRCNREGKLNDRGQIGEVVVFEPDEEGDWRRRFPTHSYYQAAQVTQTLLNLKGNLNINDPGTFREYYRRLYDLNDPASQNANLDEAIKALAFPEIARAYRIIENNAIQVLVPWAGRKAAFDELEREAATAGISAQWMRRAQGLAVSVYRTNEGPPAWAIPAKLRHGGHSEEWYVLEGDYYDETLGLNPPKGEQVFIA
ncbi:MAG: CRISPR-associated endonuclease Cas3'' [Gammaproteobacteria bacterium]|nr:CRISPR-associated endonuclease Cas3'' [Gammaproteobacteria bacterium]